MRTRKRIGWILPIVVLVSFCTPLFATQVSITWHWEKPDEKVIAFRYQLDGEQDDAWTVVDASVLEYTVGPLEKTKQYSLFLQQTHDKAVWSDSSVLIYEPPRKPPAPVIGAIVAEPVTSSYQISITWGWEKADEDVIAFRYQLDGEKEDDWTVVDASILSYVAHSLNKTRPYSFFLQQTYDREIWSDSSVLVYDPPEEEIGIEEEFVPVIEPEMEVEEFQEEPFFEEPFFEENLYEEEDLNLVEYEIPEEVLEESVPLKSHGALGFFVGLGGRANTYLGSTFTTTEYIPLRTRILPSIAVDYIYSNWKSFSFKSSLGFRAGIGYQSYQAGGVTLPGFDAHGLVAYEYALSDSFALDGAVGLSFLFTGSAIHSPSKAALGLFLGPVLQVNGRYQISDVWSVLIQAETRMLLSGKFKPYELTGIVRLGIGYRL